MPKLSLVRGISSISTGIFLTCQYLVEFKIQQTGNGANLLQSSKLITRPVYLPVIISMLLQVSGGGAPAAASAPAAGGAAPAAESKPAKKEEAKEESDDDMGFGLFD